MPIEGKRTDSRSLTQRQKSTNLIYIFFLAGVGRGVCEISFAVSRVNFKLSLPSVMKIPIYKP